MVGRFQRQFLRAQRALRDMRRFTPPMVVNNIVQNAGQVNVGAQQVNVTPAAATAATAAAAGPTNLPGGAAAYGPKDNCR